MALAPFFERVFGAIGGHLSISRESLTTALKDIAVGVRCGDNYNKNDLWISELCVNLLARLYPQVGISGPVEYCKNMQQLAQKINPNIHIQQDGQDAMTICIGSAVADGAIYPNATGWVAHLNHAPLQQQGPLNPYASGVAATLACAELFRRIFLKSDPEIDVSVSLLNYDKETGADFELKQADIGEVLFVGIGAVGNAALWALARDIKIQGKIWLVDPEDVELSNLQRYVLTSYDDVGRSKILLAKKAIRRKGLTVKEKKTTLEKLSEGRHSLDIPTTVISVDNVDGRRAAQTLLPRLIINGWTSDQALGASWHVFSRNAACLACLYHPHGQGASATEQAAKALGLTRERAALLWVTQQPLTDADIHTAADTLGVKQTVLEPWRGRSLGDLYTDVVCGAIPLDVAGVGKLETVPLAHQSALAGLLMATELLKRTQSHLSKYSQSEPLITWDNILKPPPAIWRRPRAREKGCICGDQDYQNVYAKKWNETLKPLVRRG